MLNPAASIDENPSPNPFVSPIKKPALSISGPIKIKVVLVGDTAVGKSAMITSYLNNQFSDEYEPTVLDVYKGTKNVKKKQYEIEIHDTSGDEHLGVNLKLQYKGADCFMICVAADKPRSLLHENISMWKAKIQEIEAEKPIALILTKGDLVEMVEEPVTLEQIKSEKIT